MCWGGGNYWPMNLAVNRTIGSMTYTSYILGLSPEIAIKFPFIDTGAPNNHAIAQLPEISVLVGAPRTYELGQVVVRAHEPTESLVRHIHWVNAYSVLNR